MAANQGPLSYVELDFAKGIAADVHSTSGLMQAAPGVAQHTTYGCYSPPNGGLAPLPRAATGATDTVTITRAALQTTGTGTFYLPSLSDPFADDTYVEQGYGRMWLQDAMVYGPITPEVTGHPVLAADCIPFFSYVWPGDRAGGGAGIVYKAYYAHCYKIPGRTLVVNGPTTEILTMETQEAWIIGPGNFDLTLGLIGSGPGYSPVIVGVHSAISNGDWVTKYTTFPDHTNSGALSNAAPLVVAPTPADPPWVFTHQGRICFLTDTSLRTDFGAVAGVQLNERIYYSDYADSVLTGGLNGPVFLAEENYVGYGTWASVNANELFLVKHRGGGVLVRGDLERPTVTRLPSVASTHGVHCIGCLVPGLGYVYGTRNGVFVWNGEDSTELLSPTLPGEFWISDMDWEGAEQGISRLQYPNGSYSNMHVYGRYGLSGRFAFAHPFIFAPNGWVMDVRTRAWWQIVDDSDNAPQYICWSASPVERKVYGFTEFVDATYTTAMQAYDLSQGAVAFQYQSHPIVPSRGRNVEIREILVTIIGATSSSVVITLANELDATQVETITIAAADANKLRPYRVSTSLRGYMFTVKIQSLDPGFTNDAPRIGSFALGVAEIGQL